MPTQSEFDDLLQLWPQVTNHSRAPGQMERELWAAGVEARAAFYAARELTKHGYYLVRPDDIGWDDIRRFERELQKGQGVLEDAGGYLVRAIMVLFGKPSGPVLTYQRAAKNLLDNVARKRAQKDT